MLADRCDLQPGGVGEHQLVIVWQRFEERRCPKMSNAAGQGLYKSQPRRLVDGNEGDGKLDGEEDVGGRQLFGGWLNRVRSEMEAINRDVDDTLERR